MKPNAVLINTSRGGIVDEDALYNWLVENQKAYAVVDTYVDEPYVGKLVGLRNVSLTPHLGSCSRKSRLMMEAGAVEEVLNFIAGREFNNRVV